MRVLALVTGFALAAVQSAAAQPPAADGALRAQLERLSHERVFFAHQSVGANLLEGLGRLARSAGVTLHIDDLFIPENGDPLLKLRNFEREVDARAGAVDVALLKFCYTDIGADTNAAALFEQYRATLRRLQLRHPDITFVHVTVPLTQPQDGWKAVAKRLVGRRPSGTIENVRREEYNALLRSAYLGREPFFDLARIESHTPDGRAVTVTWHGRRAPALASEYTEDGGHLNDEGKLRAARELAATLARAVPASLTASAGR